MVMDGPSSKSNGKDVTKSFSKGPSFSMRLAFLLLKVCLLLQIRITVTELARVLFYKQPTR